jgi:hypothetical protein
MIKLSNSSIILICPDGSKKSFDAEEIEARIIKSCISAGIREAWIAEDISLAVEFSLEDLGGSERFFALSEINATVVKILQETGYPEVAEKYMLENALSELELNADKKNVSDILSTHLGVGGGTLDRLVTEILQALNKLGIKSASPALFLEMARHYRKSSLSLPGKITLNKQTSHRQSPWLLSKEDIKSRLPGDALDLVNSGVLSFNGVSRLFPSLKIDFKILNLMQTAELTPPITELSALPLLNKVAASLNEIMKIVSAEYASLSKDNKELPFYLFVNDMSLFAKDWLSYDWPDCKAACMEMIEYFEQMLDYKLFKTKLK